jgi:hypothetical protein
MFAPVVRFAFIFSPVVLENYISIVRAGSALVLPSRNMETYFFIRKKFSFPPELKSTQQVAQHEKKDNQKYRRRVYDRKIFSHYLHHTKPPVNTLCKIILYSGQKKASRG